jgi:hypothetical protein
MSLSSAACCRAGGHVPTERHQPGTTLSWSGDTAAEGIARQVLAAIEAPWLRPRPRPRRAALARLDLALALTAAGKHDEDTGVALEAVRSGRLAPVDGRQAHEIVLAVAERGVPRPPSWPKRTGRPAAPAPAQPYPDDGAKPPLRTAGCAGR